MPELNLSLDFLEHRKTKRLQLRLGNDAAIYPIRLWIYVGRYHPENGLLSGYSREEVASICSSNATSNATSIIEAMLDGFLEEVEDGFQVHDWLEHQGHLMAFHVRAKKGAKARWDKIANLGKKPKKDASSNPSSNAPLIEAGLVGKEDGNENKEFDEFKKIARSYPGRVNGAENEFKNFKAKYPKEWKSILPKLGPGIEREKEWRARAAEIPGHFLPGWAHLQTWINQGRWDQLLEALPKRDKASFAGQL